MAGTINREDIAAVRERAPIEDIVGQHVSLKPAGVGSLKGLCPFHDERSPSFHVRPQAGRWHCFGCGEGGDVIEFVMRMDGLTFVDAVEYLAERAGVTLRYEQGAAPRREGTAGQRKRLLDAHRVAAEFYVAQLSTPEARTGRDFLTERGFGRDAAEQFGVGYAPQGWQALTDHLRKNGFTDAELRTSGLVSEGARGVYDRFRGRLVWPIRDVTGEVIGFGARRLYDDDQGPKYLNTPETPLYKKAQVLYGLDLAKGTIRSERTVVVVEGYTDVMACHLAGVTNAVATCGTAFGEDHVKVVRRLMGDTGGAQLKVGATGSKVIFTFDGDEAGQNAALKAFSLDQQFLAQTFVAVDADGQDPCEIRQHRGDDAVRALMDARVPLFEFVLRTTLASHDLNTIEGRVAALRAAAPVVAGIRDRVLQPEYARRLAGWLGMDVQPVRDAVSQASRSGAGRASAPQGRPGQARSSHQHAAAASAPPAPSDEGPPPMDPETGAVMQVAPGPARPSRRDPVVRQEALSLGVLLQLAGAVSRDAKAATVLAGLAPDSFMVPQYRMIFEAMAAAGGPSPSPEWVDAVVEQAGPELAPTISELAVTPLPHDGGDDGPYAASVLARLLDFALTRRIAEVRGAMQRAGEGTDAAHEAFAQLIALENERRSLRGE